MAIDMRKVRPAVEEHLRISYGEIRNPEIAGFIEVPGGREVVVLLRFQKEGEAAAPGLAAFYVSGDTNPAVKMFVVA